MSGGEMFSMNAEAIVVASTSSTPVTGFGVLESGGEGRPGGTVARAVSREQIRMTEPVGVIGLGLLGTALAERLLAGGFPVVGFDLAPGRREALVQLGGTAAASAAGVAVQCRRVLLSLLTSAQSTSVVGEIEGVLAPGALVVDTTTGSPAEMEGLGARLALREVAYLDATVAGNSAEVRRSDVLVLAGGSAEAFAAGGDLFACFARCAYHLGPCGAGARMKLVFNLALGLHRAVLGEALVFAEKLGIAQETALAILKEGAAASRAMETKGEKMLRREFSPQARLHQHRKDVELIVDLAEELGARVPLSELHLRLLRELEAAGWGDLDNSVIVRAFEQGS